VFRSALTISCALLGGALGYFGFVVLLDYGFYALALPGGLLGLAAGIVPTRSRIVPTVCALLAIAAGLLAEHRYAPFRADQGLGYFLVHAADLRPVTIVSIGAEGLIGFWVPFRRRIRRPALDICGQLK
jgi:hypothetical protein